MSKYCKTQFLLVLILAAIHMQATKRYVKFTNLKCTNLDHNFSKIEKCLMKALRRERTQISLNLEILQKPLKDIVLRFHLKKRDNNLLPLTHNFRMDICAIMENKNNNALIKLAYNIMNFQKFTNLNKTCPLHQNIIVDKWELEEQFLSKLPFPLGNYGLSITWLINRAERIQNDYFFTYNDK